MEVGSRIKLQKNSGRSVTLSLTTPAMVGAYFAARVEPIANIEDADRLRLYLKGLLERKVLPPMRGNSINLTAAAKLCGIPPDVMKAVKKHLMPIADSICRTLFTVGAQPYHPPKRVAYRGEIRSAPRQQSLKAAQTNDAEPRRPGPKSRPIAHGKANG